jgi:hypothetical protein
MFTDTVISVLIASAGGGSSLAEHAAASSATMTTVWRELKFLPRTRERPRSTVLGTLKMSDAAQASRSP